MHKNYFLEIISEKPALFEAILRFNGIAPNDGEASFPTGLTEVFAEVFAEAPKTCLEELWNHGPSRKHLRTLVSGRADPFWDFSEESRRLALLEQKTLDELAVFYGASLHAPDITRTIMGNDISGLREALGQRAYEYALQRGQYQTPAAREEFSARHREMPLPQRILLHGREAVGIVVSGWPQPLQNRVAFTPPADMPVSSALQNGIWFTMKKILFKEVASAWAPCFA